MILHIIKIDIIWSYEAYYHAYYAMNNDKTKQINWESSKRLMFGSLVCLSMDFFKNNFLIGVICERDVKKLKDGIVYVRFDTIDKNNIVVDEDEDQKKNLTFKNNIFGFFDSWKNIHTRMNPNG